MAAYISGKNSWLRCLVSFLSAAAAAALFCVLADGPRLGYFYDFLLRRRPAPPVSRELLIIESAAAETETGDSPARREPAADGFSGGETEDNILDPGAVSSLLYTLTELGATTLIIQVPVLGLSTGGNAGEAEILYRFDEEFSLLNNNIRNLFDAIRTGSVAPGDAAGYVGKLVELSGQGKERLVSALIHRDGEGVENMEKAAAFFGNVRRPGDLRVQLIRAGENGLPGTPVNPDEYSRSRPDRDGILRRIAPVLTAPETGFFQDGNAPEHIIYGALKTRFEYSDIEAAVSFPGENPEKRTSPLRAGPVLVFRNGTSGEDIAIPLDKNGALLFELPRAGQDFRRISVSDFLAYDEADRDLRRLLAEGEALGIYRGIDGENHPGILYDYALSLRDELLSSPVPAGESGKTAWIESRRRYFDSLDDFLYGPAEMNLVAAYDEIINSEFPDRASGGETGIARMTQMRDSLIGMFVTIREKYNHALELRNKLEAALNGSFCILGKSSRVSGAESSSRFPRNFIRAGKSEPYYANPGDAEASALLANSILTGRAVIPGEGRFLLFGSLLAVLLVCFVIKSLGPVFTAGLGAFLIFLTGAGFSHGFIFSGIRLDPLVPAAAAAAGVLVSCAWALFMKGRYSRRFRLAFGPFISRRCLKSVIRAGSPLPSQILTARAAIIAVKNTDSARENKGPVTSLDRRTAALSTLAFREKAAELVRKEGGAVIGTEGDMICACFGSPLERAFLRGGKHASPYGDNIGAKAAPAARALDFVTGTARLSECASWQFGLDMGNCGFTWTALSGYFALGTPVQKAKILARLAGRYRSRIVISASVNEALSDPALKKTVKRLGAFKETPDVQGESFYCLDP